MVGAGQAGLSAAYFLPRFGIENSIVLDHNAGPGGAWRQRWPSLTLRSANHVHDLPGWGLQDALGTAKDKLNDLAENEKVQEAFSTAKDKIYEVSQKFNSR